MLRSNREWRVIEGSLGCERIRPDDEVVEAQKTGAAVQRPCAGKRLLRVLVVDDDRDTAESLATLVRLWGHDVRQAGNGAAALELAATFRPDLLLLDIAMPGMDGCRLAQQLRQQTRHDDALLVAVTGYGDEAHRLLSEEAGFDLHLVKPVEPDTLKKLLQLRRDQLPGPPTDFTTVWPPGRR